MNDPQPLPTDAPEPCPFCGAAPESSSCYFAFECETCGAHGPTADSAGDEAIALWNRRTPSPVGVEPVFAFRRKGLDDFCTCTEKRYAELSLKPNLFETRIFYTTPQPTQAQVVNQANRPFIVRLAEDFAEECVTAGYVTTKAASYGRLMDEALSTQAQAGAVPLTDEKAASLCKMGPVYAPDGRVVRTPEQYRRELEGAKLAGIRTAERAHGIKGGQHGTDT